MFLKANSNRTGRRILQLTKNIYQRRTVTAHGLERFALPARYAGSTKNIWVEYIQLALDHKPAVNLGQGFPDFGTPKYVTDGLAEVSASGNVMFHQYTRSFGHPRLVNAISKLYSMLIGREINPQTEILVAVGGYEALFSTLVGHIDEGDEVIIIEPFFDCYQPMVRSANGIARFIPLRKKVKKDGDVTLAVEYALDTKELEGLFNPKTKAIIVNSPNNPIGKVYTQAELEIIANLCKKWNVLCISDEVYEWMIYKPHKHIRLATLPGMWERTITIGSAGKSFSVTGWKIGWAYGPANLMHNLYMVHQNCVYTCATPLQEAIALGFEKEFSRFGTDECFFMSMARQLEEKRDFMVRCLKDVGMKPIIPDGCYFVVADWSPLASKVDLSGEKDKYKDYRFTKWMTKNIGLLAIPLTAFYGKAHKDLAEDFVRFCFIKKDENLKKAAEILQKWKSGLK